MNAPLPTIPPAHLIDVRPATGWVLDILEREFHTHRFVLEGGDCVDVDMLDRPDEGWTLQDEIDRIERKFDEPVSIVFFVEDEDDVDGEPW